jgi:hypothetical protein
MIEKDEQMLMSSGVAFTVSRKTAEGGEASALASVLGWALSFVPGSADDNTDAVVTAVAHNVRDRDGALVEGRVNVLVGGDGRAAPEGTIQRWTLNRGDSRRCTMDTQSLAGCARGGRPLDIAYTNDKEHGGSVLGFAQFCFAPSLLGV